MLKFLTTLRDLNSQMLHHDDPQVREVARQVDIKVRRWIEMEVPNALDQIFSWREPGPGGFA